MVKMENLKFIDSGGSCFQVKGGDWSFYNCTISCAHASSIRVENDANVHLSKCIIGGEGKVGEAITISAYGALQEQGLVKNTGFGVHATGTSSVNLFDCIIRWCSSSAIIMLQNSIVKLDNCLFQHVRAAFMSGSEFGRQLCVKESRTKCVRKLWEDDDRPHVCEFFGENIFENETSCSECAEAF
eukprot:c21169_g1_i2.p1 GENE.c21169_g1_i2~~c21169_g1_i2.p1  ORF type:complete len:185 (-),score=84.33 c21169_g1_i2:22-576(-)